MAAKPKKPLPPDAATGLARDQTAPIVGLKAKKPPKISRGK
jgi:hypothetical protein